MFKQTNIIFVPGGFSAKGHGLAGCGSLLSICRPNFEISTELSLKLCQPTSNGLFTYGYEGHHFCQHMDIFWSWIEVVDTGQVELGNSVLGVCEKGR